MHSSSDKASERARWIEAGKVLAADPTAKVPCPKCADAFLEVKDVAWPDGSHFDRHMSCPACGSYNVLTKLVRQHDDSATGS